MTIQSLPVVVVLLVPRKFRIQAMVFKFSRVPLEEENRVNKLKVTMVGWSLDDKFVITAVNDCSLKVWDSYTGELRQVLKGHEDEVFVLETHTTDPRIVLSAGHDGRVIMWDIVSGKLVNSFKNTVRNFLGFFVKIFG
jgi:WD40 repeat protein